MNLSPQIKDGSQIDRKREVVLNRILHLCADSLILIEDASLDQASHFYSAEAMSPESF